MLHSYSYAWIGFVAYSLPIIYGYFTDRCFMTSEIRNRIGIELFAKN